MGPWDTELVGEQDWVPAPEPDKSGWIIRFLFS